MQLFRYIPNIPIFPEGSVVTVGNFDGFHRGHQALLTALKEKAHVLKLPVSVMFFEPQPSEFFLKEKAPRRIFSFREKIRMLSKRGVNAVYCPRFNTDFSEMSARDFVYRFIFSGLNARYVLVGEDFRFGKNREGDIHLLQTLCENEKIEMDIFKPVLFQGERVSSTRIRNALSASDFTLAENLLGEPYTLSGKVVYGDKRASGFGVPTANILFRKPPPISGVFCVSVTLPDKRIVSGIANIGTKPTFNGKRVVLEVHLFETQENLYGQRLSVRFLKKLRDEKKFSSVNELIEQIHNDVCEARKMCLTFG